MQTTDKPEFAAQLAKLCVALNVPPSDERCNVFWSAFQRLSLLEFARIVQRAIGPDGADRPTIPALWAIKKLMDSKAPAAATQNAAERLCEYVMRHFDQRMSAAQIRGPWTFHGAHGAVSSVAIAADGTHPEIRVSLRDIDNPKLMGA